MDGLIGYLVFCEDGGMAYYDKESFFENVMPIPEAGCWLWMGFWNTTGYGQFSEGPKDTNRTKRAHRVAWRLYKGPIPPGLNVLHKCDVRSCCNPTHLFLGTQDDNIKDMAAKGRHWSKDKTHCIYGHEYTKLNTGYDNRNKRYCKDCKRIQAREWYRAKAASNAAIKALR